jgi:hypothetical protein
MARNGKKTGKARSLDEAEFFLPDWIPETEAPAPPPRDWKYFEKFQKL